MEVYVVNEIPYWNYIIEDYIKNSFEKYFPGKYNICFGKGYYRNEYYRWRVIIKVASDGYIRVGITDSLTNYHAVNVCRVSDGISYSALYIEKIIFPIQQLLDSILKEFRVQYESIESISREVDGWFDYCLDTDTVTQVKPMSIDEIKYMMNDAKVTLDTYGHIKGENDVKIKKVHFNDPVTVVIWEDGTKTIVRTQDDESYDPEKGLAMCIAKKALGNTSKYYGIFKEHLADYEPKEKFVDEPEEDGYETPKTKEVNRIGDGYDDIKWAEKAYH